MPDTIRPDDFISSGGTTYHQDTSHVHSSGTSTTQLVSSTSLGTSSSSTFASTTSTSLATTTSTTTQRTTVYIPPETTIPYVVTHKETNPPEPSTPDEYDNIPDNHHPLPEDYDQPPYEAPEPETEPPIVKTPPPPRRNDRYERPYDGEGGRGEKPSKPMKPRINSEAEERTAMIIGIVAGALIAVILVILLVLWIKSNGDRSYKMEHDLKYGHGANAALLGHNAGAHSNVRHVGSAGSGNAGGQNGAGASGHNGSGGHHMNQHHSQAPYQAGNGYNQNANYDVQDGGHNSPSMGLNGSLRHQQGSSHYDRNGMSTGLVQPKAKRNSKDIKEWYV